MHALQCVSKIRTGTNACSSVTSSGGKPKEQSSGMKSGCFVRRPGQPFEKHAQPSSDKSTYSVPALTALETSCLTAVASEASSMLYARPGGGLGILDHEIQFGLRAALAASYTYPYRRPCLMLVPSRSTTVAVAGSCRTCAHFNEPPILHSLDKHRLVPPTFSMTTAHPYK